MFGGKMAQEIAAAVAARENKRRSASGTSSSFEDILSSDEDMNAAPTDTRARNRTLMSRRPTPPKILPTGAASFSDEQMQHESPPSLKSPPIPTKSDPPGWNSKWAPNSVAWMEQQEAQKSGAVTMHPVPYQAPTADSASFHAPLQSWVPLQDKERRNRSMNGTPIHTADNSSWLQSEATRTTLDRSVPVQSWQSGKRPRQPTPKLDEPVSAVPHSWAPHLHPDGVDAARLESSLTHFASGSTHHSRSRKSRDTAVSSSYDGTMIDDDESGFGSHSSMESSTESSSMIEVVSDSSNSRTGKMANRIRRPDSKVTMASSIISASYDDSSSNSTDTAEIFARARKIDASKSRSGSRVTFVGEVTGGNNGNKITFKEGGGSTDGEDDEESEEEGMERGNSKSDPVSFLVDADDTFQVFDDDCNFAPSRGTLCVLCLCIVVAAQGVAIGLYFALR